MNPTYKVDAGVKRLTGYLVNGKRITLPPEPTDEDIEHAVLTIKGSLSSTTQSDYMDEVVAIVTDAFREGANVKEMVDDLIKLKHKKETAFTLGKIKSAKLNSRDVKQWASQFFADTEENRARWRLRFELRKSKYICPICGWSGRGFQAPDSKNLICRHGCYFDDRTVFSRIWSAEEWKARQDAIDKKCEEDRIAKKRADDIAAAKRREIESRVEELYERLQEIYGPPTSNSPSCGMFANRKYMEDVVQRELTVSEIVALWEPVRREIDKMTIEDDEDDDTGNLIARAIVATPISVLRGLFETRGKV